VLEDHLQLMVDWNFLFLTAFLTESEHGTFTNLEVVFDPQRNDGSDASKCVSQDAENRLVSEPDNVAEID
jgi:hypothetical protein